MKGKKKKKKSSKSKRSASSQSQTVKVDPIVPEYILPKPQPGERVGQHNAWHTGYVYTIVNL